MPESALELPDSEAARQMFNRATELRLAGKTADAVLAFDELIKTFQATKDPFTQRMVAMALFNKGIALRDGNQATAAAKAFRDFVQKFREPDDAVIGERVASALLLLAEDAAAPHEQAIAYYDKLLLLLANKAHNEQSQGFAHALTGKGIALANAGRIEYALVVFEGVLRRFEKSAEPWVGEYLATAKQWKAALDNDAQRSDGKAWRRSLLQRNYAWYSLPESFFTRTDIPAAAKHALENQIELALAGELAGQTDDKGYAELHERLLSERLESAAELNSLAWRTVLWRREEHLPFCLFLRNFDLEAYEREGREPGGEAIVMSVSLGDLEAIERSVGGALAPRLPVIGIQNPTILRSDYRQAISKLELPDESWRETLRGLIQDASFVVMHLTKLSPGVAIELEELVHAKSERTVVILRDPKSIEAQPDSLLNALSSYYNLNDSAGAMPDKDSAALKGFQRVMYEQEVPFELLDLAWQFSDLLPARA